MKSYIDATSTCFLISLSNFYNLLYPNALIDIETSIDKIIITYRFEDKLKELQDKYDCILIKKYKQK